MVLQLNGPSSHFVKLSSNEVNKLLYRDKKNCDKIQELLQIEALSADMRELFKKRLSKINPAWKEVKEV